MCLRKAESERVASALCLNPLTGSNCGVSEEKKAVEDGLAKVSQSPNRVQLRCVPMIQRVANNQGWCLNPLTGSNCGVSRRFPAPLGAYPACLNPLTGSNCGVSEDAPSRPESEKTVSIP